MAPFTATKRKLDPLASSHAKTSRPSKKPRRKQTHYSSPSPSPSPSASGGQDFAPISLADSDNDNDNAFSPEEEDQPNNASPSKSPQSPAPLSNISSSQPSSHDSSSSVSDSSASDAPQTKRKTSKRNDPSAFSASISAIINSKLSTSKRSDPVLARSASAQQASSSLANTRLEIKAKRKLKDEKKRSLEKGRVRDVLLGGDAPKANIPGKLGEGDARGEVGEEGGERKGQEGDGGMSVGAMQEQEKRLRKTAQRGVVKLFNAVRAAQVKGEEAAREKRGGGRAAREERVREMGREGFLELVAGGGKAAGVEG